MGESRADPQAMPAGRPRLRSFGNAVLDERSMRLLVRGREVEIELKPLEALRYLLDRGGEAVSKDELIKAVWPGRVISDSALTSTIAKLREALGDEPDAIKTVHGFGYRLEVEVRTTDSPLPPAGEGPGERASSSQPSRRLAAIMFTDLVGYSALAHKDEALAIELLELHRTWIREILPRHGGTEIETVGDAFLIEFAGALAAVECALAIQQRFADHNAAAPEARRMQLRIGIHLGDVEHKDGKVMGDGVNIASRIHGMAEPGGICVSEDVQRAVRTRSGLRYSRLGTPQLKNIATRLELFSVAVDTAVTIAPIHIGWPRGFRRRYAIATVAAVALSVLGVGLLTAKRPATPAAPSVAVLPFANLSSDQDSEYFADGVHDAILAHLSKLQNLKVISRTSVQQFRSTSRSLREIGALLGVAHIVEGSVQRSAGRVRVTAQLIDARSDEHLWAETYDRDLADVFAIQSEIARKVAEGVRVSLSPLEVERMSHRPTTSTEAYDLYLRVLKADTLPATAKGTRAEIALLERAIDLDPGFAEAYADLSTRHNAMQWWFDASGRKEHLERALRAAEASLRLKPDLANGYVALAQVHYWGYGDYDAALENLRRARELAPGSAEVAEWAGYVLRRTGRWEESLRELERAAVLAPLEGGYVWNHAHALEEMRRYREAEAIYDRMVVLDLMSDVAPIGKAYLKFRQSGELQPVLAALSKATPEAVFQESVKAFDVYLFSRDFGKAAQLALGSEEESFYAQAGQHLTRDTYAAVAWMLAGDARHAARHGRLAARDIERSLKAKPEQPLLRLFLAFALDAQGDRTRARAEALRSIEDSEKSGDAMLQADVLKWAPAVFARVGDDARALDLLERSLQAPYGLHAYEAVRNPFFDRLRSDPRFKALIAAHLPAA